MTRDFDLIRTILKQIEAAPAGELINGFEIEGYSAVEIGEHLKLILDAGLIKGEVKRTRSFYLISIQGLTWSGHDFLNAAKDDSLWKLAKEKVIKRAGALTFDLLLEWLKIEAKKRLELLG